MLKENANSSKVITPFRYAGGKFYALKILKPFWELVKHDEYREPFVGGGSVFFAKPKVKFNWINDKDENLILIYKILADSEKREKLIELVENEEASKKRHTKVKEMKPRNELEKAFKYYYLNRTSFSGKMKSPSWGYRPKRSLPPHRWCERMIPCGEKLGNVKITSQDFEPTIKAEKKGKKVLMFIDPPYYDVDSNGHYINGFNKDDHTRLMKILKETENKFFLTYDDCEDIRKMYDWAHIYPVKFFYRLDNSRDRKGKRMKGCELVITNYKIKKENQLKLDVKWKIPVQN